ncbi:hypothetical protein EVAR_53203_1 [Eumeta japonica]|uniref:Transmembrane protein n=1 Tax=Eumeta variegata TaxID=151549 RepID=A0A4C1XBL3_EUMVA|nr:hypothetical protein EVAR_53203_1 [Eumeta japonica]
MRLLSCNTIPSHSSSSVTRFCVAAPFVYCERSREALCIVLLFPDLSSRGAAAGESLRDRGGVVIERRDERTKRKGKEKIHYSLVYTTVAPAHVSLTVLFHGLFLTVLLSHFFQFGRAAKSLSPPSPP